jgi:Sulfotransferase family
MIVFLHIHKTAGSTFQFILENTFGLSACHTNHTKRPVFRQEDYEFARKFFPWMKSLSGHNLLDPMSLDLPQPFHITFLREPVARTFSHYQDSILTGTNRATFEESLKANELLENLHVKLMAGERNLDKAKRYLERCNFVGLTEQFDLSLHMLGKLSPHPLNLNYKRRRTAPNNNILKPLTGNPDMVELARKYNQLDLQLYDFAIKEIFPKFCEKTGFQPDQKVPSFDRYTDDRHWRYRLCHFYNLSIYRQCGKLRRR